MTYIFPEETDEQKIKWLVDLCKQSYHGVLSWNVKVHNLNFGSEHLRKVAPDYTSRPEFDAKWDAWLSQNQESDWWFIEDARRNVEDWSSYPGDDQGDWHFSFEGRNGGWLVLDQWCGHDLRRRKDPWDFECWLSDLGTALLDKFWRGIVCACADFTQQNAKAEIERQAAFRREILEEKWSTEIEQAAEAFAAAVMESRPDMYAA